MPIRMHPAKGSIVLCDFSRGFVAPEMIKPRPVVIVSVPMKHRPGLCTVVPLSTTPPVPIMPFHAKIDLIHALPPKMKSTDLWVKGDMIYSVSFGRLNLIRTGKDRYGNRQYYYHTLTPAQIKQVQVCVLNGLNLSSLTIHL